MLPSLGIYREKQDRFTGHSSNIWPFGGFRKDDWWVAISSDPKGHDCSYYCFWRKVHCWTSVKKLLSKPGNVGNLAIKWCDFLHERFTLWWRAGAGVLSETLDIRESYALDSLATVFHQRYMQFSPVLTTVGARTCTTWRFVYVLIAGLRSWLYPHIQFCLNFYTSAGYYCKISPTTLRAMRRLVSWREWARIPISVDRSLVFHCRL
jgi:hypothetical protein